jgi:uncharacterized protein YndB with AHSA1/START domain
MAGTEPGSGGSGRELVLSRRIGAPRERVFDAWCDARHIGQWWGPNGFTTDIGQMDVRPGGVRLFTMHGPDGTDYHNRVTYLDVARPAMLRYELGGDDGVQFTTEVTFAADGEATALTLRASFASVQQLEQMKKSGAVEGGEQMLDRLERYLAGYGSEM